MVRWSLSVACALGVVIGSAPVHAQDAAPETPSASQAPAGESKAPAKAEKKEPSVTGGYSWKDKPRRAPRRRVAKKKKKLDPNAPIATYPGFALLPNGKSRVWVQVSRKVDVRVSKAAGSVTYILPGAQVGVWNNTHPLLTSYFETPLASARLRPDDAGAQLVLTLRDSVEAKHTVMPTAGGGMVLTIELPKPTHTMVLREEPARRRTKQLHRPRSRRR